MKIRTESKYFHPRPFVGNNIEYRIGSSAALGRFKDMQSFLLTQLAINPFHEFSQTAKEILLFKFDVWFDLLCEIEQYILIKQEDISYEEIMELAEARSHYAYSTLSEVEFIDKVFFKHYKEIILSLRTFHEETLKEIIGTDLNPSSVFGAIVDIAIRSLNHILYIVQELDVVLFSDKTPVINLDAMSCRIMTPISEEKIYPAINRIERYQTIRPFNEVIIKDYIEMDSPFENSPLCDKLVEDGIKYKLV